MKARLEVGGLLESAMAAHRAGDLAQAARGYKQILAVQPENADALHLLGVTAGDSGDVKSAVDLIERAVRIAPALPFAHYHLGNFQLRAGDRFGAERSFRKAAALQPDNAMVRNNLGGLLLESKHYAEAGRWFAEALACDPGLTSALINYAITCEIEGRFDDVVPAYDRVLARDPENINAHHYRALALLARGRFAEGWPEATWRWRRPDTRGLHGRFGLPLWNGEDLGAKRLLVWTEQGPGDEILIAGMIPDLIARGLSLHLLCSPRMVPLFARAFVGATVSAWDEIPAEPADCAAQASFSELGRVLRPDFASFGQPKPYLKADPAKAEALRRAYGAKSGGRPVVGLSWRSRNAGLEHEKSLALADWRAILTTPGITFVNLQYGDSAAECTAEAAATGASIIHDASIDPLKDLDAFAAQVAAVDLVISVSNTTVHVAGALGRPVWAMIPAVRGRHWYWFLDRADSPWYPQLRLFRQPEAGQWAQVIATVAQALKGLS